MHALLQDFRFSVRQLRKSPGFALTAILTLALGVGANVVVFSVLNTLVLRPLAVPDAHNLYQISHQKDGWDNQSYLDYLDYRDRNTTFSDIAAYSFSTAGVSRPASGSQQAKPVESLGFEVSGNYFDLLGVHPELGRYFHQTDEHGPGSAPYVVLSHGFWHDRLNSDPNVIGSTINLDKHPYTIVGIAPESFHGTELLMRPDFWVPMVNEEQLEGYSYLNQRSNHQVFAVGRLKPGATPQQAADNLNAIAKQLSRTYPQDDDGLDARLVKPGLMGDGFGRPARAFLLGLMLMALLVLLASCANLASVFAARAADRSRETAIRMAIGSGRWPIMRQLLVESITVALIGGAVGMVLASYLLQALSRWQPVVQAPVHVIVSPDPTVYVVAFLLSLGSGIFFGLLPVRQSWRIDAAQAMKSGSAAVVTFRRLTLRDILLVVQIAVCTLLVTSSFVALRGMERSLHANFGFNPQGVTMVDADLGLAGYSNQSAFLTQKRMIEEAARIPGVRSVATIDNLPLGATSNDNIIFRQDETDFRFSSAVLDATRFVVSPGYMQTAGTPLLAGRDFTWHDDGNSPHVAIVNATFARMMFGNSPAVGRHFRHDQKDSYEVIGVVEDGKYRFLTEDQQPAMFLPLAQHATAQTFLVVRSQAPTEVAAALQRLVSGLDSNLPFTIHSWQNELNFALFPSRIATAALGVMGLLAAMLAVTGIFGMASYSISKRMKELGIRIALGAQPMQVMRAALQRPVTLLIGGSVAGLILGMLASGVLAHIVYEATPRDPLVLGGVVLTMTLLGMLATWIPAHRAQSVDPARLLREE